MVERQNYGKLRSVIEPPDLIEIQTDSYRDFLQGETPPAQRANKGLQGIFKEVFPIVSSDGNYVLEFVKYELDTPKYTALEALREGDTYAAPLNATFRLKDKEEVREESVYMGEIPLMTEDGAFVINGAERVIVSQLHRSPGLCSEFTEHNNGSKLYSVRFIPDRGSWIELQFDVNDLIWVFLDRRRRSRKFLVTTFMRCLGFSGDRDILSAFYTYRTINTSGKNAPGQEEVADLYFSEDVRDPQSGIILGRGFEQITVDYLKQLAKAGVKEIEVIDASSDGGLIIKTIRADATRSEEEALRDVYHKIRPGDPVTASNAKQYITRMFFDNRHYDLGKVGRYKLNQKLADFKDESRGETDVADDVRVLDNSDIVRGLRLLIALKKGERDVDDIDHLGSRRIRTAGELVENQCRVGITRTERLIRDRMSLLVSNPQSLPAQPQRLVNAKTLASVVNDFFGRSQLSQFMDQTNPLSGLAHKRRLSALGPGGLSRERAGFEVRDVHPSHYGRICPIETPEGPNIGLISSLGTYARINEFGFIETPYRKVTDGKVTDEVTYLSADEEERYVIAQANAPLNPDNTFANDTVRCRHNHEFTEAPKSRIQYMDVSPMQVISIAAGLIPFLEHDDANRALMGANMMRQAVPLLRTERPYVATGLEKRAARDSRVMVTAAEDGVVVKADALEIIVSKNGEAPSKAARKRKTQQVYKLQKFRRTNANTCFNQSPIVKCGQVVKKGDVLADGPATAQGELALGKNLLVAFMPWRGYNFEDSILVSQRIVRDDIFTSVHITDFECSARESKLGPEEITRDIPNVGEDALRNLDSDGVVRVGAEVKPGDILVGKITPKSETELAPEEKLLRAIFGDKAAEVRDSSLRVPPGTEGVVMDIKVTMQNDVHKGSDTSSASRSKRTLANVEDDLKHKTAELVDQLTEMFSDVLLGEKISLNVEDDETGEVIIEAGRKITKALLARLAERRDHLKIENSPVCERIMQIREKFRERFRDAEEKAEKERAEIRTGESETRGAIKSVKVYIAEKKNLSVGDKLAGRHGNKGVVARILPDCDMPFLQNGRPVDIILNPMGVPSRMNIGQIFETHLGIACRALGIYAGTPAFDGVLEEQIQELLREASTKKDYEWINEDSKTILYDGLTGEPFDQRIVVGVIYMLKLHHLVTDKIHARAVGPYSLVTQQPLGGKAQSGGQRMGEMEVWAFEAYGAAYTLQELLTVKSDDVSGRTRIYESIVKGKNALQAGMPETFSVLMKELNGLCLNMELRGSATEHEKSKAGR